VHDRGCSDPPASAAEISAHREIPDREHDHDAGDALHEATEIDRERINDNLADYHVPVNADIAEVEVILVPEVDHDVNPAGVKGLGELANVGTAAAIANAVYHATGIRVRDSPNRIEKLLTA
jgi:xanthine dehydrogenase YagR molybdenum-binding subunit